MELFAVGLAVILDGAFNLARNGRITITNLSSTSQQTAAISIGFIVCGVALLILSLVWRPPKPGVGEAPLGIKALAVYTGAGFFAIVAWISLPSYGKDSPEVNAFLATMFLVIFAGILYVLAKSLWKISNSARITAIILFGLTIIVTATVPNLTSIIPGLFTPIALIWYLFRHDVRTLYNPPPPPEAAAYVLRTRAEAVKCPHCGAENSPSSKSCEKCGTPLVSLTEAGAKPITSVPSLMIPVEEELKIVEAKLDELTAFRKGHTLLNQESYDGLIEMQKRRLEELRAMIPGQSSNKQKRAT